jgi:hypothetical protein
VKIRDRITDFRRVKASELRPNPRNWRTHPQAQQDALRGVLAEIGYADALIARERDTGDLELLDGHLRAETTPDAEVPVLIVDLTDEEADKLLACLDPMAAMAETDRDKLGKLLHDLSTDSDGLQAMLDELGEQNGIDLFEPAGEEEAPEPQIDRAAELQETWGTERGQLWEIPSKTVKGGIWSSPPKVSEPCHRLLCGDSTSEEDVGRVVSDSPSMMLTDPPYGVGYDYESHDDNDIGAYWRMCDGFMGAAPDCFRAITVGYKHNTEWFKRYSPDSFVVWFDKTKQSPHSYAYLCKSELVLLWGKPKERYAWDTFEVQGVRGDGLRELHTCPKPVELWSKLMEPQTGKGDAVLDPFLGSGTTMVAAEQLGRICYGIEIEPKYVAVALQRMTDMGLEPRLTK